jgi:hypothetical protein
MRKTHQLNSQALSIEGVIIFIHRINEGEYLSVEVPKQRNSLDKDLVLVLYHRQK